MIRAFKAGAACLLLAVLPLLAQQPPPAVAKVRIERFTQREQPIEAGGQRYVLIRHGRKLIWPAAAHHQFDPDSDETTESIEIADSAGNVIYRRSLVAPAQTANDQQVSADGSFGFTTGVSMLQLEGRTGSGLLLDWGDTPSAPDACSTYQFFSAFGGKLAPMGEPFCSTIDMSSLASGRPVLRLSSGRNGTDIFTEIIHTGRFYILAPVVVDFVRVRLSPEWRCPQLTSSGARKNLCDYAVRAERMPQEAELTYVRLFPEPEAAAVPAHVVIKRDSKVEFLGCRSQYTFGEVPIEEHPWLKVRIDGKTGWVRDDEDLDALGLPLVG